jgi:4-amino-4-deoxy-L-arabinose transferase-like glycosyltransferase
MSQAPALAAPAEAIPQPRWHRPGAARLGSDQLLSDTRQRQLLVAFLVLGVLARCVRYFLRFPLWEDECFLCVNFAGRGYLDILQPLQYHQVAPPLFLWIELSAVHLLGFTELSLRLFPFLCSMAGLFLFRHLAGRLLRGLPLVMAVAIFAAAYPCIRYAAEAKPYASDQLVSLGLLALLVRWWRQPAELRRGWALIALVPLAIGLSYPAVFVAGGVSLVMAAVLALSRARRGWLLWLGFNAALLGSFALVFLSTARRQSQAELGFMDSYWGNAFPPLAQPLEVPGWLLQVHTGDLLAYPAGGGHGASTLTFLCFVPGIAILLWRRQGVLLLFTLAPFALNLTAAALQRYPYGGHMKFAQHLSPLICLLAGLGAAGWVQWFSSYRRAGRVVLALGLLFPFLVGAGSIVRDLASPGKTWSDLRARAFAQWFWYAAEYEGEAVCLKSDLGLDFSSKAYRELSWAAMYLCNQRIYSPRHAAGEPPRWERIAAGRPLRCVLYRDPQYPCDEGQVRRWLGQVQQDYRLIGREIFPLPRYDKRETRLVKLDHIEIFTFVPRAERAAARRDTAVLNPPRAYVARHAGR